jgi:3-oxoacyl-[acyl-carrier protein] reductase
MNILITGASRGIGAALAESLTSSGHSVLLVSRNRAGLEQVEEKCNRGAGSPLAHAIPFDLTDLPDLEKEFLSLIGGITESLDALVNNAGQLIRKPFSRISIQEAKGLFDANFFAPALLIRLCLPLMEKSELKHVVNVTSMAGFQGSAKFSGLSFYGASKAALGGLTECLAEELKPEGFSVNGLAIGSVQTEMFAEAFPGFRAPLNPPKMAEFMKWFILEGAGFFNGKVLPVSVATP